MLRHSLISSSASGSYKVAIKMLSRAAVSSEAQLGKDLQSNSCGYWQNSISCRLPSSVQFSHSVVSDSLQPHECQHARPPSPSPTPGVHSNSCPSSWWCHPNNSSSVILFSSHLQSFPASGRKFFQWVSSLHQVAKVLEFQLQHQSFQWTPRTDL